MVFKLQKVSKNIQNKTFSSQVPTKPKKRLATSRASCFSCRRSSSADVFCSFFWAIWTFAASVSARLASWKTVDRPSTNGWPKWLGFVQPKNAIQKKSLKKIWGTSILSEGLCLKVFEGFVSTEILAQNWKTERPEKPSNRDPKKKAQQKQWL